MQTEHPQHPESPAHPAQRETHDAVIVGAGPAGLALARAGLRVAVVDSQSAATLADPPEDRRETALTHPSIALLQRLGVWSQLQPHEVGRIREARVVGPHHGRLLQARTRGRDIGDAQLLAAYDRRHRRDTALIYHGTHAVARLFAGDSGPQRLLRQLVLDGARRLPPLQWAIRRQLTGSRAKSAPMRRAAGAAQRRAAAADGGTGLRR